jgi:hypothetical protein
MPRFYTEAQGNHSRSIFSVGDQKLEGILILIHRQRLGQIPREITQT